MQYEGAIYHVINRGNYRRDVFETAATAQAFERVLGEACERHGWELHAYVVMRNHYHLAVGTPRANLIDGMHWLQSTFATRFNRFRSESGHLFQGRYRALLVEDAAALARVVNYIHLNPVRAKMVPAEHVGAFRWSSLARYLRGPRLPGLTPANWLEALGLEDSRRGWIGYVGLLVGLGKDPVAQEKEGFAAMSCGWAIGTDGWRRTVAKDYARLRLSAGWTEVELREAREAHWTETLSAALHELGKSSADVKRDAKGAAWKIGVARRLRREVSAPCRWIAEHLNMGRPSSVRVYLCASAGKI